MIFILVVVIRGAKIIIIYYSNTTAPFFYPKHMISIISNELSILCRLTYYQFPIDSNSVEINCQFSYLPLGWYLRTIIQYDIVIGQLASFLQSLLPLLRGSKSIIIVTNTLTSSEIHRISQQYCRSFYLRQFREDRVLGKGNNKIIRNK